MRYLKIKNGYIVDSITFAYGDYVKFEGEVPVDIMSGSYLLVNDTIIRDEVKHQTFIELMAIDNAARIAPIK